MATALKIARRLWLGEAGATMVEYVLLISFIALVCFVAVAALGMSLAGPFQGASNGLS